MSSSQDQLVLDLEALMQQELFPDGQYQYQPLQGSSIRLLRLEPGTRDLKGTIAHASLDSAPAYEALSYAWGSSDKTHSLQLGQATMPITESLYVALKYLRKPNQPRTLWIDAICINQHDNSEKEQQILLMYLIYCSASCVLCWLGEESALNPGVGIRLTEKIHETDFSSLKDATVTEAFLEQHGLPPKYDPQWTALEDFWRRPWFRRAWVVQEFHAAKKIRMLYGKQEADWRSLSNGAEKINRYVLFSSFLRKLRTEDRWDGCISFFDVARRKLQAEGNMLAHYLHFFSERDESCLLELAHIKGLEGFQLKETVLLLQSLFKGGSSSRAAKEQMIELMTASYKGKVKQIAPSTLDLTIQYARRRTSDLRDKIFAFLAMSSDSGVAGLRPSYSKSVEAVYTRFARHYISKNDAISFRCLQLSGTGYGGQHNLSLPSWVPDWSKSDQFTRRRLASGWALHYAAGGDSQLQLRLDATMDELYTRGGFIGVVEQRIDPPNYAQDQAAFLNDLPYVVPNPTERLVSLGYYFQQVDELMASKSTTAAHSYHHQGSEVTWRILIANCTLQGYPPDSQFREHYDRVRAMVTMGTLHRKYHRHFPFGESAHQDLDDALHAVAYDDNPWLLRSVGLSPYTVLCKLDNGYVGLFPLETKVGDCAYLAYGASMPLAIRPLKTENKKFSFLGVCYIHGMMNGEALDMHSWHKEEICLI